MLRKPWVCVCLSWLAMIGEWQGVAAALSSGCLLEIARRRGGDLDTTTTTATTRDMPSQIPLALSLSLVLVVTTFSSYY